MIDRLNPFAGEGGDRERMGQVVVVATLVGPPLGIWFSVTLTASGAWVAGACMLLANLSAYVSLALLWRTRSLAVAGHIGGVAILLSFVADALTTGGLRGSSTTVVALLPLVLMFTGGRRAAFGWVLATLAIVSMVGGAQLAGVEFVNVHSEWVTDAVRLASLLAIVALVHALSWAFDVSRERAESALAAAAEDAEAASRAKTAFLAHMSHEIRTPLSAIIGYAELLDDLDSTVSATEVASTIRRNATHLLSVINDILDVSKLEAGKMPVEAIPTDPVALVQDVADLMRPSAEGKGLSFELVVSPDAPRRVRTDPTRLRQILLNLCSNAVKYTATGAVTVEVGPTDQPDQLAFVVRDTGVGMSADELQTIQRFEAFRQADASTARRFGGTGLGLRISQAFAELLGGGITVDSLAGQGSTFTLVVTAVTEESETPERPQKRESWALPPELRGARILLVEDGIDNQRLFRALLRRAGAEVEVADDGRVAVERILAPDTDFELVLMDVQMPHMDGLEATRRVRAAGFREPILSLTAHAMAEERTRALRAGCNDFLTKPIERETLFEACARWLAHAREGQPV